MKKSRSDQNEIKPYIRAEDLKTSTKNSDIFVVVNDDVKVLESPSSELQSKELVIGVDKDNLFAELPEPPNLGEKYDVLELVGSVGLGCVWKVRNQEGDAIFAVNILRSEFLSDEKLVEGFKYAAELSVRLKNPYILTAQSCGMDNCGRPYVTMDYVNGETLEVFLARVGKLDECRALSIATQLCEAIVFSHSVGLVHCDLKPSNILVYKGEFGEDCLRLIGFGMEPGIHDTSRESKVFNGSLNGVENLLYLSQEQLMGEAITNKVDVYAVGCIIFKALTGQPRL